MFRRKELKKVFSTGIIAVMIFCFFTQTIYALSELKAKENATKALSNTYGDYYGVDINDTTCSVEIGVGPVSLVATIKTNTLLFILFWEVIFLILVGNLMGAIGEFIEALAAAYATQHAY